MLYLLFQCCIIKESFRSDSSAVFIEKVYRVQRLDSGRSPVFYADETRSSFCG